jgi:tRNA(fMet)-specific endonuclease VapC
MRYLLDANVVVGLLNDATSSLPRTTRETVRYCGFCHRNAGAVLRRIQSRRRTQNAALLDSIQFEIIAFDKEDARQAAEIRALLASQGTPIGPYDVLIAGQARSRNLILVTHNTDEFRRVPGLRSDDWEI